MINPFKKWKPKGKIYSFRCSQCGDAFISSHSLDAPLCGTCIQKIKSLDATVDNEKKCSECGNLGVIYGKTDAILVILILTEIKKNKIDF